MTTFQVSHLSQRRAQAHVKVHLVPVVLATEQVLAVLRQNDQQVQHHAKNSA